jgi:hypothetical protein
MTDPIKDLIENLKKKGVNVDENNIRASLTNQKSASEFYKQNESELGVDKDYFMSFVNTPTRFEVEHENANRQLRNTERDYQRLQNKLRDEAEKGIQSADQLFSDVEVLEKRRNDLQQTVSKLNEKARTKSRFDLEQEFEPSEFESAIVSSKLDKDVIKSNKSTKAFIAEESDKLVPFLSDQEKEVYAPIKQIQLEEDSNSILKQMVDNLSSKKRTQSEEMQFVAAKNALGNSNKKIDELKGFYQRKKTEIESSATDFIKQKKAEKTAIINTLLPEGIKDEDLVQKMIADDPELDKKIRQIDKDIDYANTKIGGFLTQPKAVLSDKEDLLNRIDYLLPGISADPLTKVKAYAVAKNRILQDLKNTLAHPKGDESAKEIYSIPEKMIAIEEELAELAPIALLNRSNSADVQKYSDSIYKNIGVALKNSGIAITSKFLDIDAKYDSPKIQAEIIEKSLNIIGEKQNVRPDIYNQTFGNPEEASALFDENQKLLNDRVFKDTKNGQIEYWKSNKSREKYYSNLKEIESKRGELNQSDGFYSGLEMAGLSFKIGVDLFLSSVLVETGIGVGIGTAKALTTVKNIDKIRRIINENKVAKATFEGLRGIKDTGNYTRGQIIAATGLKDAITWGVASTVIGGKAWEDAGASEGFLGGVASAALEQVVPKPIIGLLSGPGKSKLRDFALKFAGQLPVEYVQENAEQLATTLKESTGSSNFLSGAAEVIANGLQGGEKWESIKEDFSKTMGWEAQKEMAYATAFLSTMFAAGSGMGEVFKNMYLDNGGDAKMLEDMSFYLNGVKKIVYDRNTYHYTGERWVDKNKKEVAPEIAAKLNEASPNTKLGDIKELESVASFVKGEWVSENGTKLEGDSLDKIIHGFRGLEEQESVVSDYKTKDVKIAEIEKDEKLTDEEKSQNIQAIPEDNFIQSDEDVIEAKQGQVLYTKNNSVFYTTKQEGSKAVSLSSDSKLVKFEDGKYYIEQKSPIEGSYEVTSGSEFRLAQAIKAANTRQGRALRTVRAFIPITKAIKKSVNGKLQGLKIVLHDGESYSKLDKGSRGHYDKASHTVHLNLSSSLGVTANHEILHPFFNAIFDATPNAKDLFYSQVSQEYKDRYQDVDEAIVEYASDRIVYSATPKLDTDPNFFARIFNNARDIVSRFAGRDAMPLDTDLNSLIGAMAQVGTQRGNNPIIKYLEGLSNKEVDTGSQKTWTERAMSVLGIPKATVNGIPYSNEDISRQLEEGLDKTISKIKDNFKKIEGFDYEASELASEHISDSAKEWVDYLENSNAPIEFRALLAAELFEYKYDGTYKERNGGIFDEFNEKHIKEVLQEGKKEGLLKQLYDKKQAAIQQQKIEDEKPRVIAGDQSTRDRTRWDTSRGNQTLEGAPIIEGATGADPEITSIAEEYAINNGIPFKRQEKYVDVDIDRATRIADEYENMAHDPENKEVSEAYNELVSQVIDQYKALEQAGYKFYFFDEENDPYDSNPYNAMRDLRQNKTMGVFATEAGYGEGQNNIVSDNNPMLKDTGIEWTYGHDGEKKRVLVNDLFRAIHDVFGHGLEGSGFRAKGEENAFQSHIRLFYGKAVGALATETRGQNSWVNFGKHGEHNRRASSNDTIFAEQKIGLMPEWTWTEGVDDFKIDPSTIQQQKIEDLPRFNQRQITDEFIDEDWDTWTSAITLISAKDSYVNALAIIDEIIAKRKYKNDDDELNDLLDDIIDFDNSDFRSHPTAVLYNNALQNNYIRFALTARAQSLYEKSTNDETKKLAKYIIGMSRLEMGDIARDAALSLTSFNANIVPTDKGIMSLFLPANMNTDKVNKKNSYKESGEQRTDIEEAKFVRDETKKRILEHLEESGNIDDVINRLLDKIESGQISQPIGLPSPKNTIDVDKKTWAKNKSDKYVSKGLDLIKNGLSHFKKLGVVPDPQGDAEAIFDIFKGSVYIALGKLLKAKQIFSEIASELGISPEKEWDKYAESEIGKAHIAEVKRTAAIDKLKKISPKTGVKETRDHFDEFFDRLRASRNKNSKRIIKNIQQKISELGENTRLNEEEVKLIEDAIIIIESENYDTEAAGYEARVGKIDELQEMLDALSSKESTNPLSQETRRRRKVREIVKDSFGGKRVLLKEIIADFIKYGSARSTLSELLADVLPLDQAKELEKEVFEELDKMLDESSEAISKEEKKNREETIKDLSNKLSSLQDKNREIEMIRGELSKLENSEDSSSKSRQMAELSDRLERLTGEKIDKNKTKQELLSDAKKELNELSSRDNLTDEEKLHKKHLLSHIKLLESNAELDTVIADLNRSIKEVVKNEKDAKSGAKKEQRVKDYRNNLIDKVSKIKEGTYQSITNKEVETTEEIKQLRKQIQELSGARSKLKSLTDRWNPEALLKAIKMGAHDLTDFFAILEDSTDFNFTPKQKKLLYHIHTLVRSSITGQNGHVQNLAATNKAIAMLRNLKSQTNKDVLKRFLYSMASEWAYDSMLSHPSSTINSLLGSVSGYSRVIVEAIIRLLKPSDRKAAFKIIKSVWGDFLDSASKAIGLFFSQRSEMALNDLENGFMASGVIDRIWRDKFKDIAKSDNGIVKKVAKIIIKLAVAPVKLMMNIFSATDVFSRNMFRSWNEKWDVYDKVVSKRTESGLDILNAINEELGLKQEVYDQANKEADDLGYTLIRKREYVAKRVLELREQFINDYILVAHADHAARKVMLINNPETSVGASFYSRMNKLNKNENDASYVSLVLMAIKNQIIPFSRNLVNFSHKHLVNTTIPISMVAAGMGKKAEIVTRQSLVANLLTQQYDNYRKTIESKQEYDEMYYRYKSMDENSPEAKSLKRKLDEFIIGGVPVFRNGKIEKEIYTKRDLLLDALESSIGYSTALMIFMSYDDDETEQGIVAKKPNWLRVTGSAHGLTYAEKDAANYTPFSIQVKSDDGWNTVLKWPYVFAHPVFFYLGSMTDKNYDKNTNYGLQESSVAEILYHLASSPLSQGSQQGLQTIADATLFVSKEDSSEETLEKLWKSLVTNTARQSVTPGAYVFMSELNRWFTNQAVMTSDDPFKNQLSKMPFLDGLADKTKLSPFGHPYTQPIPIKLAEYFFEDNGQENELTNINKYLVENSVNGVLKYYNSGSNISDDLQGDILIKGFPKEKQFELRDAVASAYGRIVAESNIYNDTKDYKKDYVTSKKALQQTFQKYYEEAIKEGKDLVLREYVMSIAIEEFDKNTYPEKNLRQLGKFIASKEDITAAMKEWGIRIDDGKIKYIDKMMSPVEIY